MKVSCILTYRESGDPARRANLLAVLQWLAQWPQFEVILTEQDVAPTLDLLPLKTPIQSLFCYNPGGFNKGWGYNVGTRLSTGNILVFVDADTICLNLDAAIAHCLNGTSVVRPFSKMIDLTAEQSALAQQDWRNLQAPEFLMPNAPERSALGEYENLCSGIVLFQRDAFNYLGGWDERFIGWGGEDDAMSIKAQRAQMPTMIMPTRASYHLHHQRANTPEHLASPEYQTNLTLLKILAAMPADNLKRLCEVGQQLAGYHDMHRPRAVTLPARASV
jgi:N-terminal domain of galactosyltransferase